MDSFEAEIKQDFLNEAKELLVNTERCFLNIEKCPHDRQNLNELFRLAHNLKGSSGAVGFSDLAEFTHKLESLLLELKEHRLQITTAIIELLLRSNDYLIRTVDLLQKDITAEYKDAGILAELDQFLSPHKAEALVESEMPRLVIPEPELQLLNVTSPTATTNPAANAKAKDENIRVSLARIEKLLNNVGELSILQAVMVQQSVSTKVDISPLMRETLSAMSKIIKDTQSITMGLRMLPIKQTFHKMERIVRDTSAALGKKVDFHLSGEETEIDKTILEQIADPLVHIIRNAVDHGLESTNERAATDKNPVGQIHLSSYHRAGSVVIEVRDDGKGLDAEKLVAKAKSKGILPTDAVLGPSEAYQLIFAAGFSTKEVVTDVSGRGVGMDVVRTNIAALQGSVEIETELGQGTCFRILLPLTLAIIDSVVVRVGQERYVVPLAQVSEFYRPQKEDITLVYERSEILTIRNKTFPVYRLASLIDREQKNPPAAWSLTALIVEDAKYRTSAILVDQIISQQQVVIKSLGAEIRNKPGVMGSAILGDGKPALILDLLEFMRFAGNQPVQILKKEKLEAS